jgi:hypothetical protein
MYILKFDPKIWGINKELFMNALIEEGILVFKGYIYPLYKNPMFINKEFFPRGCPINCQHYGKDIDYSKFESLNPVAERACADEAVWLDQRMLLGNKNDMNDIVGAIMKLQYRVKELREIDRKS